MAYKVIAGAVQTDADICNFSTVDPPKNGTHVGKGIHVVIPPDWLARCTAGEKVVGCTYAQVEADGTMVVTPTAETNQVTVVFPNAIALAAFRARLAAGTVVP